MRHLSRSAGGENKNANKYVEETEEEGASPEEEYGILYCLCEKYRGVNGSVVDRLCLDPRPIARNVMYNVRVGKTNTVTAKKYLATPLLRILLK